jgi:ferric-dicitrate binding protein FerR (iron transport regulator)
VSDHDDDMRLMRKLTNEMRDEAVPDLDWDRLEAALLPQIEREAAARRRLVAARQSRWSSVALFAAAAAAVVLFTSTTARQPDTHHLFDTSSARPEAVAPVVPFTDVSAEPDALPKYSVRDLAPNTLVTSDDEPMQFTLPGVATWTLEPHSRVVVDSVTLPHRVTLQQGSIVAEVVPRESSNELIEAFVVEAGTTRVAVHGTVFSVELLSDRVNVEVTHGSVTVGPSGHRGATTGRVLVSPAHAAFSLQQGRFIASLPARARAVAAHEPSAGGPAERAIDAPHEAHEPAPVAPTAPGPGVTGPRVTGEAKAAEPPATSETPTSPRPLTVNEARAMVTACLEAAMRSADGTMVTIGSEVSATLDAEGKVASVRFSPPLRPDLQTRCSGSLWGRAIESAGGRVSFSVHVRSH